MNIDCERAIILFVRRPELGQVKTRLAAEIGEQRALDIYNLLLSHTRKVVSMVDARLYVFYADQIDEVDSWSSIAFSKKRQVDGDLGRRMYSAFRYVLESCRKVLIIGSDCAQLRPEHLEEAWSKLESFDIVMGPSYDGGYYLLGLKNAYEELFREMTWSCDTVATITKERASALKLSLVELATLSDIDYAEDWERYGAPFIFNPDAPGS